MWCHLFPAWQCQNTVTWNPDWTLRINGSARKLEFDQFHAAVTEDLIYLTRKIIFGEVLFIPHNIFYNQFSNTSVIIMPQEDLSHDSGGNKHMEHESLYLLLPTPLYNKRMYSQKTFASLLDLAYPSFTYSSTFVNKTRANIM